MGHEILALMKVIQEKIQIDMKMDMYLYLRVEKNLECGTPSALSDQYMDRCLSALTDTMLCL